MNTKSHYFYNLPDLNSDRLILRKILLSDAEDIFEYASVDEVTKYLTWQTHKTIGDTKQFIYLVTQNYMDADPGSWAIYHKEDKKVIGTIGFVEYVGTHRRAEVGFALSHKYWNKGITSEALRLVLDFGFNYMELMRVEARCYTENLASQAVLKKCGFIYEGTLRNHVIVHDRCVDLQMYSLLKSEYKKEPK